MSLEIAKGCDSLGKAVARSSFCLRLGGRFLLLSARIGLRLVLMLETGDRDVPGIRHLRIRITNPREIAGAGFHVQIFKQPIISILSFDLGDARFGIKDISKNNRFRRADFGRRRW